MATFKQRKNGTWRAEIVRVGIPYQSRDGFATKREAQRWANTVEFNLTKKQSHTLHEALQRYVETVSIHHKGARWERTRVARFKRQLPDRLISALTSDAVAKWRDERLKVVSTGSVKREMSLFAAVIETATVEWGWIQANPFRKVKRPPDGKPRDRIITPEEVECFIAACRTPMEIRVAAAFQFALETGMRAGEIVGIRREHISPRYVDLLETKNGTQRRVPLSKKARELLPEQGFGLSSSQLDVHFRTVRDKLNVDFTFHATRHTAATRIGHSGKLSPWELCAMFGWKRVEQAMTYINSSITSIADRL